MFDTTNTLFGGIAAAGFLASGAAGQILIIDDFDGDDSDEIAGAASISTDVADNIFNIGDPAVTTISETAAIGMDVGLLSFSAGSGVSASLELDFDPIDASAFAGFTGFLVQLDFAFSDGDFAFTATITDDDAEVSDMVTGFVTEGFFGEAVVAFDNDVITDLSAIDSISFEFNPESDDPEQTVSLDFTLLEISVIELIPAPGAIALFAGAGLLTTVRRRN